MADEILLTLTADVVSAHVSNNAIAGADLPALIQSVYVSLASLGQTPESVEEKREPAVSIRASVKPDHLVCLEDGKKLKMLKRHLATRYNLTPAQYRARWNLPSDYPMVAPDYAARRKELALKIGLGRNPGQKDSVAVTAPAAAKPKATRKKAAPAEA